jgi:hypothetical protein
MNNDSKIKTLYTDFPNIDNGGPQIPIAIKPGRTYYMGTQAILLNDLISNNTELKTYFDGENDNPKVILSFISNAIDIVRWFLQRRASMEISPDTITCQKTGDNINVALLDRGKGKNFKESEKKVAETSAIVALKVIFMDLLLMLSKQHYNLFSFLKNSEQYDKIGFDDFWSKSKSAQLKDSLINSNPTSTLPIDKSNSPLLHHMDNSHSQYIYNKNGLVKANLYQEKPVDDAEDAERDQPTETLVTNFIKKSCSQ